MANSLGERKTLNPNLLDSAGKIDLVSLPARDEALINNNNNNNNNNNDNNKEVKPYEKLSLF